MLPAMRPCARASAPLLLTALLLSPPALANGNPEPRVGGSAAVGLTFPTEAHASSVGPTGAFEMKLTLPSFPYWIKRELAITYSSRGGDGPLGMGWGLPVPNVRLDLSRGRAVLERSPSDQARVVDGVSHLTDRWSAVPGGRLVCSDFEGGLAAWNALKCTTSPRGHVRFEPVASSDGSYAQGFIARDPMEQITQHFGESAASRIETDDGRPIIWLISREVTAHGREIGYLYEEPAGSDERLLSAIQMGPGQVIDFQYVDRTEDIRTSYASGVRRRTERLLTRVQLRSDCDATQSVSGDDIQVSLVGACTVEQEVVLTYAAPSSRYTGRYVLRTWQHFGDSDGDGSMDVMYNPAHFTYVGDGIPAESDVLVEEVTPQFQLPPEHPLANGAGHAPYQSMLDWDGDGIADIVHLKDGASWWPAWHLANAIPSLHVQRGLGDGTFEATPSSSYEHPIAKFAAWLWDNDGSTPEIEVFKTPREDRNTGWTEPVLPEDLASVIADWDTFAEFAGGAPNIGIDVRPWMANQALFTSGGGAPHLRSLSLSVACEDLVIGGACADVLRAYRCAFEGDCGTGAPILDDAEGLTVQLWETMDMNGDGHLDFVLSGLLVNWDPSAPDLMSGDEGVAGFRDPVNGDPCLYVSFFDPSAEGFSPFVRYDIPTPEGAFDGLTTSFLSALSVTRTHNGAAGSSAGSAHLALGASLKALGASLKVARLYDAVAPKLAVDRKSVSAPDGWQVANAALGFTNAPPHVTLVMDAGHFVADVKAATTAFALFEAGFGFGAAIGHFVIGEIARRRMMDPGYVGAVVAANANQAHAALGAGSLAVSAIGATASLLAKVSLGAVLGGVGVLVGAVTLAISVSAPDIRLDYAGGDVVTGDVWNKRGILWRKRDARQTSRTWLLSAWRDIDSDGWSDLVVASYDADVSAFAVSRGDTTRGALTPASGDWISWELGGEIVGLAPKALDRGLMELQYMGIKGEPRGVHRAGRGEQLTSMVDINGDGLADLVDAAPFGLKVYANNGRGFETPVLFPVDASAEVPGHDLSTPRIGRSRSLDWQEFVSKKEGYQVNLSTTHELLGPDLNNDGLPDLVYKSEDYPEFVAGDCARVGVDEGLASEPMPTQPEPECKASKKCSDGDGALGSDGGRLWYADFDDGLQDAGYFKKGSSAWVCLEGETHLTTAAHEMHAPTTRSVHYVAFNTGTGFGPFVAISSQLPSLGGSLSVVSETGNDYAMPDLALSGASQVLGDPYGSGRLSLVTLDIDDPDIKRLDQATPVESEYRLGLANPDALVSVDYPEGGRVDVDYGIKVEIHGEQGAPMWVLSKLTFDDAVGEALSSMEGWLSELPHIEFEYAGAHRIRETREFLGFEYVGETRHTGASRTQIVQAFEHGDVPERGALRCFEVRGRTLFDAEPGTPGGRTTCGDAPTTWSDPKGPYIAPSCASALWDEGLSVEPLLERQLHTYDAGTTTWETLEDGRSVELMRSFVPLSTTTLGFGSGFGESTQTELLLEHDPTYHLPERSSLYVDGALRRELVTTWQVDEDEWVFLKSHELARHSDGSVRQSTAFSYTASPPYQLLAQTQTDAFGESRTRTWSDYHPAGVALTVTDGGIATRYRYYDDGEYGVGQVEGILREDHFINDPEWETTVYDAVGNPIAVTDAAGHVSTWTRDGLGLVVTEERAGFVPTTTTHHHVGQPGVGRGVGQLETQQRLVETVVSEGQTTRAITWVDGFGRSFRTGRAASGVRTVEVDFEGDGTTSPMNLSEDADWFASRSANYLLDDRRLDALGAVQCQSLHYVDSDEPQAWATQLFDPLRRARYAQDFSGFGAHTLWFALAGQAHSLYQDDAATQVFKTWTADGHLVAEQRRGGPAEVTTTWQVNDYGEWTRRTDGEGGVQLRELNGWGQPLVTCQQLGGAAPTEDVCPVGSADWAVQSLTYDARGQVATMTDPNGHLTRYTSSRCGAPGFVQHPSASTSDSTLTSIEVRAFDARCLESAYVGRDSVITLSEYDEAGRRTSRSVSAGGLGPLVTRSSYDGEGRLRYVEGTNGSRVYSFFDFRGGPIRQMADVDRVETTAYDLQGRPSATEDAAGFRVEIERDLMGRETRRTWTQEAACDPSDLLSTTDFGTFDALVSEELTYDAAGRLVERRGPDGATETFVYDGLGRVIEHWMPDPHNPGVSDANDHVETRYDGAGRVVETIRWPRGLATEVEYDAAGRVVDESLVDPADPSNRIRRGYEYDAAGQVVRELHPSYFDDYAGPRCVGATAGDDGFTTEYAYSPMGQVEVTIGPADASGARPETLTGYDRAGRVVSQIDPMEGEALTIYDPLGRVSLTQAPDGAQTSYEFDDNGWLIRTVSIDTAEEVVLEYDRFGQVVAEMATGLGRREHGYDSAGRRVWSLQWVGPGGSGDRWEGSLTDLTPGGQSEAQHEVAFFGGTPDPAWFALVETTQRCFDQAGRVLRQLAPGTPTRISELRWDLRGRKAQALLTPVYGSGAWTPVRYTYDGEDRLTRVEAPMGSTGPATVDTEYGYDWAGRIEREWSTNWTTDISRVFDAEGRACVVGDSAGSGFDRLSAHIYSPRGTLVQRILIPGGTEYYSYDLNGRLVAATDASGGWEYVHDEMGRPTTVVQTVARLGESFQFDYLYDAKGRVTEITYPSLAGFAGVGSVGAEYSSGHLQQVWTTAGDVMSSLAYDGAGRVVEIELGNGALTRRDYDTQGRLSALVTLPASGPALQDVTLVYNAAGGLERVDDLVDPLYRVEFGYDARMRLASAHSPLWGGTTTYAYNHLDRLDEVAPPAPAPVRTLSYDARGNLAAVSEGGAPWGYQSDAFGNRERDERAGQALTYDALDRVVEVRDLSGGLIEAQVYAHDTRRVESGDTVYLYGAGRHPLVELQLDPGTDAVVEVHESVYLGDKLAQRVDAATGEAVFYAHDYMGAPVIAMSSTAVDQVFYGPLGERYARPLAAPFAMSTEVGFQGALWDEALGLSLMHHRYYDPVTSAFVSRDPIGLDGGPGRRAFALGNPAMLSDPLGLEPGVDADLDTDFDVDVDFDIDADLTVDTDWFQNGEIVVWGSRSSSELDMALDGMTRGVPAAGAGRTRPGNGGMRDVLAALAGDYSSSTRVEPFEPTLTHALQARLPIGYALLYGVNGLTGDNEFAAGAIDTATVGASQAVRELDYPWHHESIDYGSERYYWGSVFGSSAHGPAGIGDVVVLTMTPTDAYGASGGGGAGAGTLAGKLWKWKGAPRAPVVVVKADGTEVVKKQYKATSYLHQEGEPTTLGRHPHRQKIVGRAQKTGLGHATRSLRLADAYAREVGVEQVYLDTSWRKMGLGSSTRRPDVTVIFKDRRVLALEVPSASDYRAGGLDKLRDRNLEAMRGLPAGYTGEYQLIHSTKAR